MKNDLPDPFATDCRYERHYTYERPGPMEKLWIRTRNYGLVAIISTAAIFGTNAAIQWSSIMDNRRMNLEQNSWLISHEKRLNTVENRQYALDTVVQELYDTRVTRNDIQRVLDSVENSYLRRTEAEQLIKEMFTQQHYFEPDAFTAESQDRQIIAYIPESVVKAIEILPDVNIAVYADKNAQQVSVFRKKRKGAELVYACSAIFGKNQGQKKYEGDGRTPEVISGFSNREIFARRSEFGVGFYEINMKDAQPRVPGSGIYLCGTDNTVRHNSIRQRRNITNGGIVVSNVDWIQIDRILKDNINRAIIIVEDKSRPLQEDDIANSAYRQNRTQRGYSRRR